jgi:hypothetical protein
LDLLLIDAIGPFFRHNKQKRINWSKIPFAHIETSTGLRPECLETIPVDFRAFVERASRLGYTGITLDDVAHLVPCDRYSPALQLVPLGRTQCIRSGTGVPRRHVRAGNRNIRGNVLGRRPVLRAAAVPVAGRRSDRRPAVRPRVRAAAAFFPSLAVAAATIRSR